MREVEPLCPQVDQHTPAPDGYVAWHEWAEEMHAKGYRTKRCPGCGLYKIWTPKAVDPTPTGAQR
jgi:hypothetical protein